MSIIINTNIASLNTRRDLLSSTKELGNTFNRLSSGLKINSSKDDAAGMSISTRMTSKVREHKQAIRNINDGISVTQIAEEGIRQAINIVQRLRELAVQSANGTYTFSDRQNMESEVKQLRDEFDNILNSTTFNKQNLLDGSFVEKKLEIGFDESVDIDIPMGGGDLDVSTTGSDIAKLPDGSDFLTGDDISGYSIGDTLTKSEWINLTENFSLHDKGVAEYISSLESSGLNVVDIEITNIEAIGGGFQTLIHIVYNVEFQNTEITETNVISVQNISVATQEAAQTSIENIDKYINILSSQRSELGALQNRLDSVNANLATEMLNTSQARSRIMDADIAAETAKLTKNNIIQQASTAILAQANQQPSIVMQLLR